MWQAPASDRRQGPPADRNGVFPGWTSGGDILPGRCRRSHARPAELDAETAARRFVSWVRLEGVEWATADDTWEMYVTHCIEANLMPLPSNILLNAVSRLVYRRQERHGPGKRSQTYRFNVPRAVKGQGRDWTPAGKTTRAA